MTSTSTKQQAVGNAGFWLFVPAGVCLLIGWLLHQFVSDKLSIVGMAALAYAIFTLIAASRNQSRLIRGTLILVNLAVVLAFGYFQWQALVPATWPSWSPWIGLGIAASVWLGIMVSVLYRLGSKSQQANGAEEEAEGHHPAFADEGTSGLSPKVTERIIAALKLTSHEGDVTVNTANIIKQLADWSEHEGKSAAAKLADSIMAAVKGGFYDPEDLPFVKKALRKLQGIPEPPEKESVADDWDDQEPEFRSRSVF